MFRAVPLPIIRSFPLYIRHWYMSCWCDDSFRARPGWNSVPSWSCLKAVVKPAWHIPVPNVQWKTPDDGQRNCPKHVQFLDKNKFGNLVLLLVLLKRNFSELTRLLSNLIGLHISFRMATGGKKKCLFYTSPLFSLNAPSVPLCGFSPSQSCLCCALSESKTALLHYNIQQKALASILSPFNVYFTCPRWVWCYAPCWWFILLCCSILIHCSIHVQGTSQPKKQRLSPERRWTVIYIDN